MILVLDDIKITDKKHHRRAGGNASDIIIRGAIINDNIFEKDKKRKKKPSVTIKNAAIYYDAEAITNASPAWDIVPGTWQEQ